MRARCSSKLRDGGFFRISRAAHLPDGNPDFGSPKPPQPVSLNSSFSIDPPEYRMKIECDTILSHWHRWALVPQIACKKTSLSRFRFPRSIGGKLEIAVLCDPVFQPSWARQIPRSRRHAAPGGRCPPDPLGFFRFLLAPAEVSSGPADLVPFPAKTRGGNATDEL